MLSVNLFKLPDSADVIKATQTANKAKGVALVGERLLTPATTNFGGGRRGPMTPEEEKRLAQGSDVFGAVCFSCHGPDGMGKAMEGAAIGAMLAPALVGSPRLQAHRDYVIKILLNGLSGPIDGKSYPRSDGAPRCHEHRRVGRGCRLVCSQRLREQRRPCDAGRRRPCSQGDREPQDAVDDAGARGLTAARARLAELETHRQPWRRGRGRSEHAPWLDLGTPQAQGMWFTVELPQPVVVTEVQFESMTTGGGRGGRGAAPGAPAPAVVVGYPRGYTVQVSTDGKEWSKPVAEGKGDSARTTITFAPTRAKFVRITETDAGRAPPWSMRSLRIYEAPGAARK